VPSGARLRLGYSVRASRDVFDSQFGVDREYKSFLGATITQPLLKGWGLKTNLAGIRVAERDADIAFQTYREQMMRVVAEAIAAYWDLYLTQEKYKVRQDSVEIAEKILRDNIVRVQTGKMAETEVLEARAGLALRESLLSEARQAIVAVMNNVRTMFSSSAAEREIEIVAIDKLEIKKVEVDFANSLVKAFKLRADYLSSRKKIEREDIKLAFAKNQRWPQLDLEGSYGVNGLADNLTDSWEDATDGDFPTWTVGVKLRIPFAADIKARSEMNAAKKRKKQALLELKAVEVALANQVDTAIQSVYSAREQVSQYARVVDFNKRLLEVEIARFKAGKSNSRLLLEKEEDLLRAKETELDSLVKYKKIILELELAEGSLLLSHGIEVMDADK
jgi:outer membrane protein TolC